MALQVVQAQPTQTISGVTTAKPTQTISGVVNAPQQTISGVSPSPVAGTSNFNPQGAAVSPIPMTVNPQTSAANPQTGAVSPMGTQTFKLGDGSEYNASGAQINGPSVTTGNSSGYSGTPNGATQASPAVQMNTPTPDITTQSTSLTNDTGYSDILKMLSTNLDNMDKLFSNLSAYATVGPEEQAQQKKVASDTAAMTGLGYQAQGLYNPDNQAIALPFLTGQAQNKLVGAGIQTQLDQSVLNYMQGNRQFAFNSASTIFDASRNNLQTMLDVYSKAAPQNLGTNYNPTTGQLTAIMRNPLSGATYTGNLGNIGAQKQFTSTNIATDPLTGALTFVGTTSDGKVVQQPIGGGASYGSSSVSNPLQGGSANGNYTQTGNPQVSNVGQLLGNWTSGNANQLPGAGYQGGVYQKFQELTGIKIDSATPTSSLVSNIPALSQAIATGEGFGKGAVGDKINNPGNILWANQANATPYTSSNGYTYAKFNTLQDGWNAMNTLVAKKLGATPTVDPKQAAANLPPALQGAVRMLADGTPYFDASQLTAAQIPQAQFYASQTGIPYLNADSAKKIADITVTQQNLSDFQKLANDTLGSGFGSGLGTGIWNSIAGTPLFGGTTKAQFDSMRTIALNAIQGLAGGSGSGFRLNAGEIATAVSNLPTIYDTKEQADVKLNALNSQMNKWISQAIPGWKPPGATLGITGTPDYTATLNNLMMGGQ